MKVFYLFRHALATYNNHGYENDIIKASILPNETKPIEKMGLFLKDIQTDFNVCSQFLRCRQTAEIIAQKTGKEFVFDKRINEFFIKDKNSRDFVMNSDVKEFYAETFESFKERIISFLSEIEQREYKNILVCTHGTVIDAIQEYILKGDFAKKEKRNFPKTGVLRIIKNNIIKDIDFNI